VENARKEYASRPSIQKCRGGKCKYGKVKKDSSSAFRDDAEASICIRCATLLLLLPLNDIDSALTDIKTFLAMPSDSNRTLP